MIAPPPAAVDASLHEELLRKRVKLLASVLLWKPWFHVMFILVLAKFLPPALPSGPFMAYAIVVICLECSRVAMASYVLKRLSRVDLRRIYRWLFASTVMSGLAFGAMAPLFLHRLQGADQAQLLCLLTAVPALGTLTSVTSRYLASAYATAAMTPTVVTWVALYPHTLLLSLLCCALYVCIVLVASIGSERTLLSSVRIRLERDKVVHDLKNSNAEVRQAVLRAEREAMARSRVLASASHDLRQPLHALSVYSAILAANPAPETLREVGSHIDQIVRSLGELLHGLLDLSQLSSGHYVSVRQSFEMDELIKSICIEFDSAAADKGLSLERQLAPLGLVSDPMAVSRITRNLIDNALKYTGQGKVTVRLARIDDCAVLTIADTGKGIAIEDRHRVFEEFYQLDNPGRDRSRGVGLGLAIVQRLVGLIGGSVTLESRMGYGSRFEVRIPGARAAAATQMAAETKGQFTRFAQRRVFLIDDEQDILRSMTALLKLWRLDVHTAPGAVETVALFEQLGVPDLLIADLRLRGSEHGLALANRMRLAYGSFKVLFVTGETSSDSLAETKATGWRLLHKPIDAEVLQRTIEEILETAST